MRKKPIIISKITKSCTLKAENPFASSFDKSDVDQLITSIFRTYSIPLSLISYCQASIISAEESKLLISIKFPSDSAYGNLSDYTKFYYEEANNTRYLCSLKDALFGNELLFTGDVSYEDKYINSVGKSNSPSLTLKKEVILKKRMPSRPSLIVLVKNGTFKDRDDFITLNRKGSHVIAGLIIELSSNEKIFGALKFFFYKIKILAPSSFVRYERLSKTYNCPFQSKCYSYLKSQGFNFEYFDNSGNRCYCKTCFPDIWIESQVISNEKYIIPRGWCRFGLKVPYFFCQLNNIWASWCNVFHGTDPASAKSIIEHKTLLLNEDIMNNGYKIPKNDSTRAGNYFTSPHICYASHPWYSKIIKIPNDGKTKYAQIVVAIKIRYNSYSKQEETEGGAKKIFDDYRIIPEDEIEWYSKRRGCTVPYGILVRIFGEKGKFEVQRLI